MSCFIAPAIGQQGGQNFPYLANAAYWENDLGLYKTFTVHEQQNVQFRISAFNWLNHPLPEFSGGSQVQLTDTVNYATKAITAVPIANSPDPGYLNEKTGAPTQRILELNVKYNF